VPESPAPQAAEPVKCDLVCGRTTIKTHAISPNESADYYTTQAAEKADQTLVAMHEDLLACYEERVKNSPKAHAFLTIDIVVGPEGRVQAVETQGGALLGNKAMACIVNRIKEGEFAAPHNGGTMRLEVPVTLRTLAPGEAI